MPSAFSALPWLTALLQQATLPNISPSTNAAARVSSSKAIERFFLENQEILERLRGSAQTQALLLQEAALSLQNHASELQTTQSALLGLQNLLKEKDIRYDGLLEAYKQLQIAYDASNAELQALKSKPPLSLPNAGDKQAIPSFPKAAMLWCPPGSFRMGSDQTDAESHSNEKPAHTVTLTQGFWMKQTPVTQGEWQAITGSNPSRFNERGLDAPVESVSWFDAVRFCNQLSKREGLPQAYRLGKARGNLGKNLRFGSVKIVEDSPGYRLPMEAEWEYACRAGTITPRYGKLDGVAWFEGNGLGQTHAVGQKKPNAWGFCDMLGNVWEWCFDPYAAYDSRDLTDPLKQLHQKAGIPDLRVVRGGSEASPQERVRAATRSQLPRGNRGDYVGFRLARSS